MTSLLFFFHQHFIVSLFIFFVLQQAETLVKDCLEKNDHRAVPEIAVYLKEAVGNQTRIDYGTGIGLILTQIID